MKKAPLSTNQSTTNFKGELTMLSANIIRKSFLISIAMLILANLNLFAQGNWEDNAANPQTWTTGNVGIGTSNPVRLLQLNESTSSHVGAQITNSETGSGGADGLYLGLFSDESVGIVNYENTHMYFRTNGTNRMTIGNSGHVVIGGGSVPTDLWGSNAKLVLPNNAYFGDQGAYGVTLSWNTYRRSDNQYFVLGTGGRYESSFIRQGSQGVEIASSNVNSSAAPPVRMIIKPDGKVGIGTTVPQSTLHVAGTTTTDVLNVAGTTTTGVLTITGGADLAEPFEMSDESFTGAGDVVVIDAENPGHLKRSSKPYDSGVAGIVSGAGGVNPGLTLKQEGVLDNGQNVALTGRVYAKVSSCNGPIKPGDLLTTSQIAGHAMKATDRDRSHGTIIGKAMTALQDGEGLVLVLVNLQ